jgi:hypothetical protein
MRRIELLEQRMPDPEKPRKSLVPEWLLEEWIQQGLQIDATDDEAVLRAVPRRRSQSEA